MEDLRLVLLGLGAVIIGVIYLWGKRRARKEEWELPPDADLSGERVLPDETKPEDEWDVIPLRAARDARLDDGALEQMRGFALKSELNSEDIPTLTDVIGDAKEPKPMPEIVLVLTVVAKQGMTIQGSALVNAAQQAGLRYGTHRIFHRIVNNNTIFSLANILEPGTFDLNAMETFTTPGVALFSRLPGKESGMRIAEEMIATAQSLARALDANLCDERRTPLKDQALTRFLEKARPYAPARPTSH